MLDLIIVFLRFSLLIIMYLFLYKVIKVIQADLHQVVLSQNCSEIELRASLVVIAGEGWGQVSQNNRFDFKKQITIGRKEINDVIIPANFVSGEHARIFWSDGSFWLEDLKSTNGTLLNGHRINEKAVLKHGDTIKIGSIIFEFVGWEYAHSRSQRDGINT